MTFEADRELIVSLSDQDAISVLGLLDNGTAYDDPPDELRAALAAAKRCPDVSRYFLVNQTEKKEFHATKKRLYSVRRK